MKEVLKLALEALQLVSIEFICNGAHHAKKDRHDWLESCPIVERYQAAITAIKEALAQPEKGLFIDLIAQHEGLADELAQPDYRAVKTYHEGKPVYVSQPEQEPVAWEQFYPDIGKPQLGHEPVAIYRAGQAKGEGFHVEFLKEMGDDEALLYTTPPQRPWVGLTDEEIQTIHDTYYRRMGPQEFARAVGDKLKELNT